MWPFSRNQSPPERKFAPSLILGMGQARWTGHEYRKLALEGFENNPVVHACVTRIARALSGIDLHAYRMTVGELRKLDKSPMLDLINAPNPVTSGRKFLEQLASHYLIGGNAYPFNPNGVNRRPGELWLLAPDRVSIRNPKNSLLPESYVYQPGGEERVYPVDRLTGDCQVLHLKTVNPLNEWYGLSPMAAASYAIDVFNAGQEWNKSLLQNQGRPSGVLQTPLGKDGFAPQLTDEQFGRLKANIDEQYSGTANAGRPMLLEGGLEWKEMSLKPTDMDHRETMLTNARFIAGVYGVPPMLVNIPGESTYSNFEQAQMSFYADTVLPLLGLILEDLNRWLAPLFGDERAFLWYDEEQVPALEPRRKEKSTRINAALYMTYDEKRQAMGLEAYQKPEQPGADSLFVPDNQVPIEMAGTVDPNLHPTLAGEEEQQEEDEGGKKPETAIAGKKPAADSKE